MDIIQTWFKQLQSKRRILANQLKDPAAIGLWKSVIDKYSDNAHFVFELLQNSDDADASKIRVYFYEDSIEYIHNGDVAFTLTDPALEGRYGAPPLGHINAITSIGSSSKKSGNKIGKFGVGFKSIFKYVDVPHIEDDNFSFDLVDYIVPQASNRKCVHRRRGETGFWFPIKEAYKNMQIIEKRFETLCYPLLFLENLMEISVYKGDQLFLSYKYEILKQFVYGKVKGQFLRMTSSHETSYFYKFTTLVENEKHVISCVLYANEDGSLDSTPHDAPVYCFFPTMERWQLNYIVHAPFKLTESRESLIQDDEWNQQMFYQLGTLLVNAFASLALQKDNQQQKLLNENIFSILPMELLVNDKIKSNIVYHQKAIREHLSEPRIFLASNGSYVDGLHTMYAENKELYELFSEIDLQILLPQTTSLKWCFSELNTKSVDKTLIIKLLSVANCLGSQVMLIDLLKSLSASFLQSRSQKWFVSFYSFLSTQRKFWKEHSSELKMLPLFYCYDKVCRPAYDKETDMTPSVYLSSGQGDHFCAIHSYFLEHPKCCQFFEMVGLQEPGVLAEIVEHILPAYENREIKRDNYELISQHLSLIADYYSSLSPISDERGAFIQTIKDVPFLPVVDCDGVGSFQPIGKCFISNTLQKSFMKGNKKVYFFENSIVERCILPQKRDAFYFFLSAAGLHYGLAVIDVQRTPSVWILEFLNLKPLSLRQADNGGQLIIDREIVGMEDMMQDMTKERSSAFFNLLGQEIKNQTSYMFRQSLQGSYQYYEKGKRTPTTEKIIQTSALQLIFNSKWLFLKNGERVSPSSVTETNQLDPMYDMSLIDLLFFLNIKISEDKKDISPEQREALDFVSYYQSKGLTILQMKQILNQYLDKNENSPLDV